MFFGGGCDDTVSYDDDDDAVSYDDDDDAVSYDDDDRGGDDNLIE